MASSEKFCLRWNDFETNISSAFQEIREEKEFFDVTIVTEDHQVEAHRVILSACSPFFRQILNRAHHHHPLLYLKGVRFDDLSAVLNFMYHGEVFNMQYICIKIFEASWVCLTFKQISPWSTIHHSPTIILPLKDKNGSYFIEIIKATGRLAVLIAQLVMNNF